MDHGKYGFVKLRSQFLKEWHLMFSFLCIMQNCLAWWLPNIKVEKFSTIKHTVVSTAIT